MSLYGNFIETVFLRNLRKMGEKNKKNKKNKNKKTKIADRLQNCCFLILDVEDYRSV
jgi:hypothetical protein